MKFMLRPFFRVTLAKKVTAIDIIMMISCCVE